MGKYALIGDIHSNYINLKQALDITKIEEINKYIFLGDYILDGFDNNKILDTIKSLDSIVIRGNKEEFFLEEPKPYWKNHLQYTGLMFGYNNLTKESLKYIRELPLYLIKNIENIKTNIL